MWAEDRIHMTPEGHRRVALAAYAALHRLPEDDDWAAPLPPQVPVGRLGQVRTDLEWAREHLVPWATRRLHGRSSGDVVTAKRPRLAPVDHAD
jgi:hypothetical protein